jgi:DNA processing protein
MIQGVGYGKYCTLLETFGSPDEVRNADRGDLQRVPGIGPVLAERIVNFDWDAELSRELGIAANGKVRIITLADNDYPKELRELFDPPLCIYIRGELPVSFYRSVAIIGSRRISNYGERMARMLAEEATAMGFSIISGMALGIDTICHRSALPGVTIGVLGSGLMHMYPQENIPLARDIIAAGGAVISEFPLDYPVTKQNFPRRNRIVAALARATVVVEAGLNSGALITARLAVDLGRDVFAVPGMVTNPQSAGCHKLIKEGAILVEDFSDVAQVLISGMRPDELNISKVEIPEKSIFIPADCAEVYNILMRGRVNLDDLQMLTGMDIGALLGILMRLEMELLVARDAEQCYYIR